MKVKFLMQNLQKNEKDVLPVEVQDQTGNTTEVSKSENIEVSLFCEDCNPVRFTERKDSAVFTDKYGFAWRCGNPKCIHAERDGPAILDCRILNSKYIMAPGSVPDLPVQNRYQRISRKFGFPRYPSRRQAIRNHELSDHNYPGNSG